MPATARSTEGVRDHVTFTREEARRLTSGDADAWLVGPPVWRGINGQWRGEVSVHADYFGDGDVAFWLMTSRPNRPSFVLVIRGTMCRRLDVNTPHRDLTSTHIQGKDDPADQEFAQDAAKLFPPIPESGNVEGEQYAAAFLAFAEHVGVGAGTFEWVDIPEGRPS